jgi:hypothetical protein
MQGSMSGKCWLPIVCLAIFPSCAKHKLTPLGAGAPPTPAVTAPVAARPAAPESIKTAQPAKQSTQAKAGPDGRAEVNRLLQEPPRMSFSPDGHIVRKDVPKIDKITVLVETNGTLRPDSQAIIQIALKKLADEFLFLCPDRMRAGSPEDCRFTTKEGLNDFFRDKLIALGVESSQAAAVTTMVHTELTSTDKNAFDIRAVPANNTSSVEQLWHVVPRNPGDHKLELRVTPTARILSAGEVQGEPVLLVRSVAIIGVDTFFNDYGPVLIGCLAALGLFVWIAWTLWRNARPSAFSSR